MYIYIYIYECVYIYIYIYMQTYKREGHGFHALRLLSSSLLLLFTFPIYFELRRYRHAPGMLCAVKHNWRLSSTATDASPPYNGMFAFYVARFVS